MSIKHTLTAAFAVVLLFLTTGCDSRQPPKYSALTSFSLVPSSWHYEMDKGINELNAKVELALKNTKDAESEFRDFDEKHVKPLLNADLGNDTFTRYSVAMQSPNDGSLTPSGKISMDGDYISIIDQAGKSWIGKYNGKRSTMVKKADADDAAGIQRQKSERYWAALGLAASIKEDQRMNDDQKGKALSSLDSAAGPMAMIEMGGESPMLVALEALQQGNGGYVTLFVNELEAKAEFERVQKVYKTSIENLHRVLIDGAEKLKKQKGEIADYEKNLDESDASLIETAKQLNAQVAEDNFLQIFKGRIQEGGKPVSDESVLDGFKCQFRIITHEIIADKQNGVSKLMIQGKVRGFMADKGIFGASFEGVARTHVAQDANDAILSSMGEQFMDKVRGAKATYNEAVTKWLGSWQEKPKVAPASQQGETAGGESTDGDAYNKGLVIGGRLAKGDAAAQQETRTVSIQFAQSPKSLQAFQKGLRDGMTGKIPAASKEQSAPSEQPSADAVATDYTVKAGDTLTKIALEQLGSKDRWKDIKAANPGLDVTKPLALGQVLNMPAK